MGRVFSSDEVMRQLKKAGWILERINGSHHVFVKSGSVTHVVVPHPRKMLPIGTLKNIERQAGIRFI